MAGFNPNRLIDLLADNQTVLVDIRSSSAWQRGTPPQAKTWSADELCEQAEALVIEGKKIFILCYRGQSSATLANQLSKQWGDSFYSVDGGFEAWHAQGLPIDTPDLIGVPMLSRYERQIKLEGFGDVAQQKLTESRVLVVGAGGLGAPALLYLTGAGVGHITLMDDDEVEIHNLHRQILYKQSDVGQSKSTMAKQHLLDLNSSIDIQAVKQRLTIDNVEAMLSGFDLVIDGSDNIQTRYLINDTCLKHNIPWVFAAVSGFNVQVALFTADNSQPCYRCLFPNMGDENLGSCEDEGVLGFVPGLAGLLQVTEAIKYLTGLGDVLTGGMLNYDLLFHQFKVLKYPPKVGRNCPH